MALFSLLVAIVVERLKLLPASLQFDQLLKSYNRMLFQDGRPTSSISITLALLLPAIGLYLLSWMLEGLFWGTLSLFLWVIVAVLCFSHDQQRNAFKRYVQSACRGDTQACYHYAREMDASDEIDAISSEELGCRVGQSVVWINYRYYGVIALYFILAGPIGAVLYCTVRFYGEKNCRKQLNLPLVDELLFILDWLPSRLFAFGYVLCGEFSKSVKIWRKLSLDPKSSARDIIVDTAMAAEPSACQSATDISLQQTISMLALSKRNFILLVTVLSLLTIFGVVN